MAVLHLTDSNSLVPAVKEVIEKVVQAAFKTYGDYGECTTTNVTNFKHGIELFCKFLKSKFLLQGK